MICKHEKFMDVESKLINNYWLLALLSILSFLSSCGSGGISGGGSGNTVQYYAVADSGNNRVLIYQEPVTTQQSAIVVLGQSDFTQNSQNRGNLHPSSDTLQTPRGVIADTSGNLYVSDSANCRILQYHSPLSNGMSASLVIGLPDYDTNGCIFSPTAPANMLLSPLGIALDSANNLWVADSLNSRVLEFKQPLKNGMSASLVIGQTDFSGNSCNHQITTILYPTASTLCDPDGVAFDSGGNLWVTDTYNSRVLKYEPPFSNGMAASLELGQPLSVAFTSYSPNNPILGASTLFQPEMLAFDASGNLFVSDGLNDRVVIYSLPFSDGMAANIVLGQSSFTSTDGGAAANLFTTPNGLSFDSSGNLFVTDWVRTVIFSPPFTTGMNANTVLGEPNFTTTSFDGNAYPYSQSLPVGGANF
jgi:sugar lactone lactonase YvrE